MTPFFRPRALATAFCLLALTASAASARSISGTVTDMAGTPLPGVAVTVHDAAGSIVGSAVVDAAGVYSVAVPGPGTYYARTSNDQGLVDRLWNDVACGATCAATTGTPIVLGAADASDVHFMLENGGRVSGRATDQMTGLPVAGLEVSVVTYQGQVVARGTSTASGDYITGSGLPGGVYYARATSRDGYMSELYEEIPCVGSCALGLGTPIVVYAGSTTADINFVVFQGSRVSGQVTDAGTGLPLAGVHISVFDASGRAVAAGTTDASGRYVSDHGLPAGDYYARTSNAAGYIDEQYDNRPCPSACPAVAGSAFPVAADTTVSGIDFALERGARLTGVVTNAANGAPIAGVTVLVFDATGRHFASGISNGSGAYTTGSGLPAGTYTARTGNSGGFISQARSAPVAVSGAGTVGGVDFSLSFGGGISGVVINNWMNTPAIGVRVEAVDAAGAVAGAATTNALGQYNVPALPSGSYFVRTSNDQGLINQTWGDSTAVVVGTGVSTSDVNFWLQKGGRIGGAVQLAGTTLPLAGVTVAVFDASGARAGSGVTDGSGQYVTNEGLQPGSYSLQTENAVGLVNDVYPNVAVFGNGPTNGINFSLYRDVDGDADGIVNTIDTAPASASDDFSDGAMGGTMSGTIAARNGWYVAANDRTPGGAQLQVAGAGTGPATVHVCSPAAGKAVALDAAGEAADVSCEAGNVSVHAALASPAVEVRWPAVGRRVVVALTTGQAVALAAPIRAAWSNTATIHGSFVDENGTPYGSFSLEPGEAFNASIDPVDGDVSVTVVQGVVTFTVRAESATLQAGQSAAFETPTSGGEEPAPAPGPTPREAVNAIAQTVLYLAKSGDIKKRAVATVLVEQLRSVARSIEARPAQAERRLRTLIAEVKLLYRLRMISRRAFETLVPQLQALADSL